MKLEDIVETSQKPALLLWWQWLGIAIIFISLLLLLRFFLKNKKISPPKPDNLKDALDRLARLRDQSIPTKDLAIQLSIIIRAYLQKQFEDTALFETHEEFHARSSHLKRLPPEAASRLTIYLGELSDLKYAPTIDAKAIQSSLLEKTDALLRGLDSTTPRPISSELPSQGPPSLPDTSQP